MRNLLYILVLISSSCTAQVHDYNIRIDSPKTTDSTYCLLTATTGSNFAGRGQFKSLPQLATLLSPFLTVTETQGIDDVLNQAQALTTGRSINLSGNEFQLLQAGNPVFYTDGSPFSIVLGDQGASQSLFNIGTNSANFTNPNSLDATFGINNTAPTEALDVTGNGLFSGTLSASNLSGTNTGDAVNIFNDPVTANGTLNYQGYDITMTNIGNYSMSTSGYIVFGADGGLEIYGDEENTYILLDATGSETATGGNIKLNSSGGNVEITTLDASTGTEDEWLVRDASTGKLYKKTLTATSLTLGAAATTFALTANVMTITGNGGGNTLATITGGISGQILTLIFADANVTITDDATSTANTVNLSAAFTSTANDILTLVHNGTSWREVSRSIN